MSERQQSPMNSSGAPALRRQNLAHRSASLNGESASVVSRKKDTIDNFKNKLNRLEQNKIDLENKMKLFDAKVNAHTRLKSATSDLDTI